MTKFICSDTSALEKYGFKKEVCQVNNGTRTVYHWKFTGDSTPWYYDILVIEIANNGIGLFKFQKLDKSVILPKVIQLANGGAIKNYSWGN